ncbi:MAG: hypothetical protein ABI960_06255, partial [Candidatus Eisenbacteria bacterium]
RSDIWALGCVLYEMFTGRRAFEGRSQASLIAAILEREPPPVAERPSDVGSASRASGPASTPPHGIERLIRNCLAKDPDERIQTAHDVKLQLLGIAEGAGLALGSSVSSASEIGAAAVAGSAAAARSARLAWALAAFGLLAAAGIFAWLYPRTQTALPEFRFRVGGIPGAIRTEWPRISPDGRYLLLQATDSLGVARAYTRRIDEIDAHPVPGTEALARAYWSPDGKEIGFVAGDKLQRVPIGGGSPTVICAASGGYDLSWGSKGLILVDKSDTDSLRVVPAGGGELRPASRIDRASGEIGSAWPHFLPDGEHFLFIGTLSGGTAGDIRLGKIGSLDSKLLGRSDGRVEYAPGGWVLFLRGLTLLAQKLDLGAGKLTGQPITIADNVRVGGSSGHFSVSRNGILAYGIDDGAGALTLQVADRTGVLGSKVLAGGNLGGPELSPDGHRLLYVRAGSINSETGEVYVLDLDRATDTRLTFSGGRAYTPHWSADGRRFACVTKAPGGVDHIQIGSSDGLGAQDSIAIPAGRSILLWQWSEPGSRLVYHTIGTNLSYVVNAEGPDRSSRALLDSTISFWHLAISPDGRFVAGTAGIIPGTQVFVQSLVGPPGRWQISSAPASRPRWVKGGKELIFESRDNRLLAVDIDTSDGFRVGTPHVLFPLPIADITASGRSWTCDPNGERFFLLVPTKSQSTGNIEVASGFHSLVSRK